MSNTLDNSREFHSFHRTSRFSRFLIRFAIPAVAVGSGVFAVVFLSRLTHLLPQDMTADEKAAALPMLALLGAILISLPVTFVVLWYALDRNLLQKTICIGPDGIIQRKGSSEIMATWQDVRRVSTLRLGRIQTAAVHHSGKKITFDAGFIDAKEPQPRRVFRFNGERLIHADGTEQPLTLAANELYQLVSNLTAGSENKSAQ